jgi:hypothetical protein
MPKNVGYIEFNPAAWLGFARGGKTIKVKSPTTISVDFDITLLSALPGATSALTIDSSGQIGTQSLGGGGSVTSVALSLPNIFTVSGSPVTASGTLSATLASQTAGTIFAAPAGAAGAPTFRAIAWTDVSSLVGTNSTSFAAGNDSRFHNQGTDQGTTSTTFQLDSAGSGAKLESLGGVVRARNAGNTAFADFAAGNTTVNGNLTVTGTTFTVDSETVAIADNIFLLNSNVTTGTPTEDMGIRGRRGASTDASLLWVESLAKWSAGIVGAELPLARVYETTFTNASLVAGVLTVAHGLGRRVVNVSIADSAFKEVKPDDITYSSTTQLAIDMTTFGTLSGTYTVVCEG